MRISENDFAARTMRNGEQWDETTSHSNFWKQNKLYSQNYKNSRLKINGRECKITNCRLN
jgi:hypothetical protein